MPSNQWTRDQSLAIAAAQHEIAQLIECAIRTHEAVCRLPIAGRQSAEWRLAHARQHLTGALAAITPYSELAASLILQEEDAA